MNGPSDFDVALDREGYAPGSERRILESELLEKVYRHEWKIATDGEVVISVSWLLHTLNDPRAE